ncbi:esterase/lipase superfamily enzyme [Labrenzia sp. EL_208]|nr:esterase/lipase superfamily enzyme [Labrenzia sp. EL_132]MBG6228147.1 esterase/lipase superfamily enzyme [Labrenzia sp. EL_208]
MPSAEVFTSLQAGSIDSGAVPFDSRTNALGFQNAVTNFVDRVYVPQIYAVLVSEERWSVLPFSDQHYLADAAEEIGESLVGSVQAQADRFREMERARGAVFNSWDPDDINAVKVASLSLYPADARIERALIEQTFDAAAAQTRPPADAAGPRPAAIVELLFATDRKVGDPRNPEIAFSSLRKLRGHSFGRAAVSLAEGRNFGDNLKNVSEIRSLADITETEFFRIFEDAGTRDIVLFLHGYNNSFSDSIRRGATIQEDIAKDAIVVSYTWPSDGELLSYGYDESSTDIAEQNLKLFMDKLTRTVDPARISIVAHSMGSRLLMRYLADLPERGIEPPQIKFQNVVFAAADISTVLFKQKEEAPFDPSFPLSKYAARITVYSSQYDRPLGLSQKLHRDSRLGLADETDLYLDADIVAIDASLIDPAKWYQAFSFATRHSYVFDKSAGVRDLSGVLNGLEPNVRPGMTRKFRNGLPYWVLSP